MVFAARDAGSGLNRLDALIAPGVRGLQPYVPGKPIGELERELGLTDTVKLASNENPLGPGPLARAAMRTALADIELYPDASGFELKARLASHHGVDAQCVTLGNGSNDILVLLAETFLTPQTEAVYSQHCFPIYPLIVQAAGALGRVAPALPPDHAIPLGHDLAALLRLVTSETRLVFVANPNNPTGTWIDSGSLRRFLQALPSSTVVVLDEAYFEYCRDVDCPDSTTWLCEFPQLVVVRTFSKAHALAGLRVGYALSQPEIAQALSRVRQPFNVNSIALAAARAALDDTEHLQRTVRLNAEGREQLRRGLELLGFGAAPSAGNFVFFDARQPAVPLYEALLRRGVIVRPAGPALPSHLRVTTGTAQQNERFLDSLAGVLGRSS